MTFSMITLVFPTYILAAFFEIAGCFAFWAVFRLDKSQWWLIPGVISLLVFAGLLTRIDVAFAGRAFAAYGGVYIAASLFWMWLAEGQFPDRWDIIGAAICIVGVFFILFGRQMTGN